MTDDGLASSSRGRARLAGRGPDPEFSDRCVVAVAAAGRWPPREARDVNEAELRAVYADAG